MMPSSKPLPSKGKGMNSKRYLNLGLLIIVGIVFTVQALSYNYVSDDAFISFRYAQNWARGIGPVYNIGERVEGYTNFLWVALLAGFHRLGADVVVAAKALGIVLGWAVLLLTYRFSLRWHFPSSLWPLLAPSLLCLNLSFAAWATGGLETHLFTFLALLAALLHLEELEQPNRFPWSGAVMALCVMTRPDGLIFVGLSGLHRLWRHQWRITWQDRIWGLMIVLLYLPYYAWRFAYYGYPFPNTFYAKYGGGPDRLWRGLEHVWGFIFEYGGGVFALLAGLLVLFRKLDRDCAYLALLVGGFMGYVVWIGGDALIEYRFLLVITPLLYLLIQQSLWSLWQAVGHWQSKGRIKPRVLAAIGLSVALLLLAYLLVAQASVRGSRERVVRTRLSYEAFAVVGQWFREQVPSEASVAVNHAGAMPFYSELQTIDMLGLNDLHIGHRNMPEMGEGIPGHEKYDAEYVLSRRPTYIVPLPLPYEALTLDDWHRLDLETWFPGTKDLLDLPTFNALYAPRSIDLTQYVSSREGNALRRGQFLNAFQLRDASLAQIQEVVWGFGETNNTEGWQLSAGMEVQGAAQSSMFLLATQPDSSMSISGLQLWTTPCDRLTVRMRIPPGTESQLYWRSGPDEPYSESQSLKLPADPDGMFHTYEFRVGDVPSWFGKVVSLRLDPADQPAEIEIDELRFERSCETFGTQRKS